MTPSALFPYSSTTHQIQFIVCSISSILLLDATIRLECHSQLESNCHTSKFPSFDTHGIFPDFQIRKYQIKVSRPGLQILHCESNILKTYSHICGQSKSLFIIDNIFATLTFIKHLMVTHTCEQNI